MIGRLERRISRLEAFHHKLHWPATSCFQAFGQNHVLPIARTSGQDISVMSSAELRYAAGFFDGDGCVAPAFSHSGSQVWINQSSAHGEALLLFHRAFGGSIRLSRQGQGSRHALIKWSVSGTSARNAATALRQESLVKKQQLHIAANWPSCKAEREESAIRITELKHTSHDLFGFLCSWSYVAGFFDAEGHIHISPTLSLRVSLSQKFEGVLKAILCFFEQECPGNGKGVVLYKLSNCSRLQVSRNEVCKFILQRMLASGLLVKRLSAELALAAECKESRASARTALASLVGNQGRYLRLDLEGCHRATHIKSMQSSIFYQSSRGRLEKVIMLQRGVEQLKKEHALQTSQSRYQLLRHDIRSKLSNGTAILRS
ncbi:unnamed protein product [Polarella glacialis]|uniref:LAGLIDADG endonuclease n=1 Tax=Polarella glacialis TaxID=89957 RepID=A0A813DRK2_POLGL|nr:unnamed protein product [Polarella glacialis]